MYIGDEEDTDGMFEEGMYGLGKDFLMNVAEPLEYSDAIMPCMQISQEDCQVLWKPWRKALIIKVLVRSMSYWLLEQKIRES